MAKQMMYSDDGRRKLLDGVRKTARAVKATMGPSGHNVILQKSYGSPRSTRDGVTVAKEVELEDKFENMGAQIVRQAASKTSDTAGDGTTAATVLTEALYAEGLKNVVAGANPTLLKRGIDAMVAAVVEAVKEMSIPCKTRQEIESIATISANSDKAIGKIIADAMDKVGKDGVITVEDGKATTTELEVVDGMQFDKGYISPYFATSAEKLTCEMENVVILYHEKKISNLRELLPLLERIAQTGKPFLVVAEDLDAEPLAALVVNKLRGVLKVCAVKAPGFGDRRKAMLQDMAILTGGKVISEDLGLKLENVSIDDLGSAKKVVVDKENTTIVGGGGDRKEIDQRIAQIRKAIETTTSDYDREKLQERLAKMVGGVAVVKVGANTEFEAKEKKDRIEDALHAARAATEEGMVPGGGVALLRAGVKAAKTREKLRGDEKTGGEIVLKALRLPAITIAANAGYDGTVVVEEILSRKEKEGFNAATGEYVDMIAAGVIDPAKVVRVALENAASAAGTLLTADICIAELPMEGEGKEEKPKPAPGAVY